MRLFSLTNLAYSLLTIAAYLNTPLFASQDNNTEQSEQEKLIQTLQVQIQVQKENNQSLTEKVSLLEKEIEEKKKKQINEKQKELMNEIASLNNQISSLNQELQKTKQELSQEKINHASDNHTNQKTISVLQEEISQLKNDLQNKGDINEQNEQQQIINGLKEKLHQALSLLQENNITIDELQTTKNEFLKQNKNLNEQLTIKSNKIKEIEKLNKQLSKEIIKLKKKSKQEEQTHQTTPNESQTNLNEQDEIIKNNFKIINEQKDIINELRRDNSVLTLKLKQNNNSSEHIHNFNSSNRRKSTAVVGNTNLYDQITTSAEDEDNGDLFSSYIGNDDDNYDNASNSDSSVSLAYNNNHNYQDLGSAHISKDHYSQITSNQPKNTQNYLPLIMFALAGMLGVSLVVNLLLYIQGGDNKKIEKTKNGSNTTHTPASKPDYIYTRFTP